MEDDKTVYLTLELTVSRLLEKAKREGEVRLVDGDDVYVLKYQNEALPDAARQFLTQGGPAED